MSVQSRARATLVAMLALALLALLALPAIAAAIPQKAAASDAESYVIKSDGSLWSWGGNAFGGLGRGDYVPQGIPARVGADADWKSMEYSGTYGIVALKQSGSLWHWGDLALPPFSTTLPTEYAGDAAWAGPWDTLGAGDMHVLLIRGGMGPDAGQLWGYGSNIWGQLGEGPHGENTGTPVPIQIGSATWKAVAASYGHSLGVKSDGSLWAWGLNDYGQLGLGDTADRFAPTLVDSSKTWKAVYCGVRGSYAITDTGALYAWGWNEYGQLGLGSAGGTHLSPALVSATGWSDLAPGPLDCLGIKDDGSLWAWGYNADGQLGLPADYDYHTSPVHIGSATSWTDVACGAYHTVAVTSDDSFAACGANQYGQIGLGFPLYRCSPEQLGTVGGWAQVDAGLSHSGGVRDDGTLWMWGSNGWGELGFPGAANAPTQVGTDTDWKAVSCGAFTDGDFTAAVKTVGTLWAWGSNSAGQLGLGDTTLREVPVQVGTDADWTAVACSDGVGDRGRQLSGDPYTVDDHTLALKGNGQLWAWGANDYGQLGLGVADAVLRKTPRRVGADSDWAAVFSGDDYSAALKTNGTLWVWGHNQSGQLGLGTTASVDEPTQVTTGTGDDTFASVACAGGRDASHMLAVKLDGTLWGWGRSYSGELGQGPDHSGSGVNALYTSPIQIAPGTDWKDVACGSTYGEDFSLAVKTSGQLWSWGGDFHGQLGNADYVTQFSPTQVTGASDWDGVVAGTNSFGLKADGTLWAWGDNAYGQLGLGDASAYSSTAVFPLADFVDTTPPVVGGSAATAVVKAAGSARSTGGWTRTPRTITVTATDEVLGAGVSRAQISLTGGISYVTRKSVIVRNGDVDVYVRAFDRKGNPSEIVHVGHYKIDSTKPVPTAKAASVKRGRTVGLRYRIADVSPCTVRIAIKNSRGKTVKNSTVRGARPMSWLTKSFRCTLARGTYRFYVTATDSVGYKQVRAAVAKLIVK